jgi:hypothetical protein
MDNTPLPPPIDPFASSPSTLPGAPPPYSDGAIGDRFVLTATIVIALLALVLSSIITSVFYEEHRASS